MGNYWIVSWGYYSGPHGPFETPEEAAEAHYTWMMTENYEYQLSGGGRTSRRVVQSERDPDISEGAEDGVVFIQAL